MAGHFVGEWFIKIVFTGFSLILKCPMKHLRYLMNTLIIRKERYRFQKTIYTLIWTYLFFKLFIPWDTQNSVTMNRFESLPDDIIEKIYKHAHELKLKRTFPYIQCKPNPYGTCIIHKLFFETTGYDRENLKHFNEFLDYIHGKAYNFPYELVHENRYMMMLNYFEYEDI